MTTQYSVSLWSSQVPFPLNFVVHLWFVISAGDTQDRYEVWAPLWVTGDNTVMVNAMAPTAGFRRFFFQHPTQPGWQYQAHELYTVTGTSGSPAHKLYQVIKASPQTYPYREAYRLWPGPNSNTYAAWALAQVPDITMPIPRNAYGFHYQLPAAKIE